MPFPTPAEYHQDGVDWAEANIILPSNSAKSGPLQMYGWQKPILRDMLDPSVRRLPIMLATQLGKTGIATWGLGYVIVNAPQTVLLAFPNDELRDRWMEEKLVEGLEASPAVKLKLRYNSSGTLGKDRIRCLGMSIYTGISGSKSAFSSIDAPLVIGDELDKFVAQIDADSPVSSLESRGSAFSGRQKLVLISSPSDESTSIIYPEYLRGSQSRYEIPCQHCGFMQILDYEEQVRGLEIFCKSCAAAWDDVERRAAKDSHRARWVDLNPDPDPGVRSYQMSALYSDAPLAETLTRCKGDIRAFWCQVVGWPYKAEDDTHPPDPDDLEWMWDPEPIAEPVAITIAVDVQQNRIEYQVVHWTGEFGLWPRIESQVRLTRGAEDADSWRELGRVLREVRPDLMGIDRSKFNGTDVRDNVLRYVIGGNKPEEHLKRMKVMLLKGVQTPSKNELITSQHTKLREMNLNADQGKRMAYAYCRPMVSEDGVVTYPMSVNRAGVPGDFLQQLVSEEVAYHRVAGRLVGKWRLRKGHPRNEVLDCFYYNIALKSELGVAYTRQRKVSLDKSVFGG